VAISSKLAGKLEAPADSWKAKLVETEEGNGKGSWNFGQKGRHDAAL
jgi:hypothetical protein